MTEYSERTGEQRACPICGTKRSQKLFSVDAHVFTQDNPTIERTALERSGLLDLPAIQVVRCSGCPMAFVDEFLSERARAKFWNEVYAPEKSKEKIYAISKRKANLDKWYRMYTYLLSTSLGDGEMLNVLDLGCGWGDFLSVAKSAGVRVIGIETDERKAGFARRNGIEVYPAIDDIPTEVRFKAFFADQVLEHLEEPMSVLRAVSCYLHSDFVGYVGVPNYNTKRMRNITRKMEKSLEVRDKDLNTWDHVNYFNPEALQTLLEHMHWEPVNILDGTPIKRISTTSAFIQWADRIRGPVAKRKKTMPVNRYVAKLLSTLSRIRLR